MTGIAADHGFTATQQVLVEFPDRRIISRSAFWRANLLEFQPHPATANWMGGGKQDRGAGPQGDCPDRSGSQHG